MLRNTREFSWKCVCCSVDPPTRVYGGGKAKGAYRRLLKKSARRKEERRWLKEMDA